LEARDWDPTLARAQAYLYQDERERVFFSALERTRRGVCACVFDVTDRIQHMFFNSTRHAGAIEDLYANGCRSAGR
jgi:hypothetical protein